MPVVVQCLQCGVSISTPPFRAKTKRFCSRTCQGQTQGRTALVSARLKKLALPVAPRAKIAGMTFNNWAVLNYSHKGSTVYFWKARCTNCGAEAIKTNDSIKRGGCHHCHMLPKGRAGLRALYVAYQSNAKRYHRSFSLTTTEFNNLTSSHCHYCGTPPYQSVASKGLATDWGRYTYNGIDRINNDDGYTPENCVPCCGICNRAKNTMPHARFVAYIRAMAERAKAHSIPCLGPQ